MAELEIRESFGGYASRTRQNARSGDLTVAFAVDFTTAGERLTKDCGLTIWPFRSGTWLL